MTTLKVLSIPEPHRAGFDDVRRLSNIAAQGDVEITVLLPDGAKGSDATPEGIMVSTEPVRHSAFLPMSSRLPGATYPRLRAVMHQVRPDVIHVDASPCSALAAAVVRLRGHSSLVFECEDREVEPRFLPGWVVRLAERRVLSAADFVLARHHDVLNWARTRGFSGPGAIVAYGTNVVSPQSGTMRVDRAPGLALGYVGALSRESGVVDVLDAVAACRVPLSLAFFGRGPLHDELVDRVAASRISDRVQVVDASIDASGDLLHSVDVAVVTARRGACKPVDRHITEVQALGIPVIAYGVPGGRELVGDAGWYVTDGDAGLLSHLLRQLAVYPEEVARAKAACIAHVQWRASFDAVGAELIRAFVRTRQARAGTDMVGDVSLAAPQGMKV